MRKRLGIVGLALAMALGAGAAHGDETAARPLVLIGDSHTAGTFGKTLDALLRGLPDARVTTYASCGSSPSWWFSGQPTRCGYWERLASGQDRRSGLREPTPKLPGILSTLRPDTVVVALGANLINASPEHAEHTSRQLARALGDAGVRCIWIGPPHGRNKPEPQFSQLYEAIRRAVADDCELIDSRPFLRYPDEGGDGIHYDHLGAPGRAMARQWARSVYDLIVPLW